MLWPNLCGMATEAPPPASAHTTAADDAAVPHTTAGKIADLERRRHDAIHVLAIAVACMLPLLLLVKSPKPGEATAAV